MPFEPRILAVAEAWASVDGKLELFRACSKNPALEEEHGAHMGYYEDAAELIRRVEARGFTLAGKP